MINKVEKYVSDVLDGTIPSCKMIRLAVERYVRDKTRDDLYFCQDDFERFCRFSESLKHFKGAFAEKHIKLEGWQLFAAANIFGWKRKETGYRRFTSAEIYVPRKNGKTTLGADIGLFLLHCDNEPAAEVYSAAVDKEQAKICFDTAKHLLAGSPFSAISESLRNSIVVPQTASCFKPLSKDTKNKDGLNPHGAICDERHAWKTNEIMEVIRTGMGARRQPLVVSISSAGTDTSNPYFADLDYLRNILLGIHDNDSQFVMLYEPDDEDPWDDPATWRKVNPNLGISLSERYMHDQYREAKQKGGSTLAAFCTKHLNMWVDAPEVWISDDDIALNNAPFDKERLSGRKCYVGIDFSSKVDISAVALYFPEFQVVDFLFYIPEAKIEETEDRVDYRLWREQGWLTVMPGKVIDEDWFVAHLVETLDKYDIQRICYDPWGMVAVVPKLGRYEGKMKSFPQNIMNMTRESKDLEAMLLNHELNFLHNPVIRWMFRNVVVHVDPNANIKLDKGKSRNKIDGVVAIVDAIGAYKDYANADGRSIYEDHDLRVINL